MTATPRPGALSRREVLLGAGALVVGFRFGDSSGALAQEAPPAPSGTPPLPGSLKTAPMVDSWISIAPSGEVTVFTGKAELGQGIKTALTQVAAEELDLPFDRVRIHTADTGVTPNEGFTAGSHSMQDSGTALRAAAAQSRALLVGEAARRWGVAPEQLRASAGLVTGPDGQRASYGELVSPALFHVETPAKPAMKSPAAFTLVDHPVPRVDISAKVTGGAAYVQDLRLPGMVHARVVRPPSYGAKLVLFDRDAILKLPGVVEVVHDGDFLAVVADREFQAIQAMRGLAASCRWRETARLPAGRSPADLLLDLPSEDTAILQRGTPGQGAGPRFAARYTRPYQAHASIGPSCAVAHLDGDLLTVWTHTQGVFPDRAAIAELLGRSPETVRCIHAEGSGCYGHNGADDAAGDAALIAAALPGRPVRLQLMREQEAAWEPFGPAMVTAAAATLGRDGTIADWSYEVWSNTHNMRPGGAGALLAGQLCAKSFAPPAPKPIPQPEGGGDRNAIPLYRLPNARVMHHFVPAMPLRVSAMRSLGAYGNVFSIESFMDELARSAGVDPVAFRLKHLDDERAVTVVRLAAEQFGWSPAAKAPGLGHGFGFARYKNLAAYCAIALEARVDLDTGRVKIGRVVAAVDSGQVVNPDGLRNQVEGAIVQSASWTLFESVGMDERRIASVDWASYPILRFPSVPESVDVHIVPRPGAPYLGSGECGQGPMAAALANAIADATGCRFRDLPLTPKRIRAGIAASSNENRPA